MCSPITPARTRRLAVSGVLCALALIPCGLVRAQEDPEEEVPWAPGRNAVSLGLHSFVDDGESGKRIGIWWAVTPRVNLGGSWRAWDRYDVVEPEVRLQGRRKRTVSPFASVSGIWQRHGQTKGTGVGASLGLEVYPVSGLALYGALGGRMIWKKWSSGEEERDPRRTTGFRLHAGVLAFPVALARASPSRERTSARKERHLQVSGGPAVSFRGNGRDGDGVGAGFSLELVSPWTRWFSGRVYAGGVVTEARTGSCGTGVEPCSVSSQIAAAGAKIRLLAPIPQAGPFIELGTGVSVGSIETRMGGTGFAPSVEESDSGLMFHVPLSVGIAFGAEHQHDIAFDYYTHSDGEHVAAVLALGIGFTLGGD